MADNYLEKKMEAHRAGASVQLRAKKLTPRGDRPGTLTVRLDPLRILVTKVDNPLGEALIKRLGGVGYKVAFGGDDYVAGNKLAQSSATLFCYGTSVESMMKNMRDRWGGVDLIITDNCELDTQLTDQCSRIIIISTNPILPELPGSFMVNAVSTDCITPDNFAQFVLYLTLPSSQFIRNKVFKF